MTARCGTYWHGRLIGGSPRLSMARWPEIAKGQAAALNAMLAAKGISEPSQKQVRDLFGGVQSSLRDARDALLKALAI
jgi:hypothetical protein